MPAAKKAKKKAGKRKAAKRGYTKRVTSPRQPKGPKTGEIKEAAEKAPGPAAQAEPYPSDLK